jgi:N-acetylglucosaminyl-diphospho-decaprenol L-rhamnosyltransferase
MRIAAVVVSYNTRDLLRRCLASLDGVGQVVVVDNASSDGSAEMVAAEFPAATLLCNAENLGFGAANNQGLAACDADAVLLLNSDAFAEPGAVGKLAAVFADPGVVAAGGMLCTPGPDGGLGEPQESACGPLTLWAVFCEQTWLERLFPRSPVLSPYWRSRRLLAQGPGPHAVEQVMGACLAMRPAERFDERFFLYCEDTDLCRRLRRHGRILYVPEARFGHELGASSQSRWRAVARYNRGKELYFAIHHGPLACGACWLMDRAGAAARLGFHSLVWLASFGRRGSPGLWWRVLSAPATGPARG